MENKILIKRAYEPSSPEDGFRIYVDRLWPRGLSHESFHYDLWDKEIAPSTELRQWFHENPGSEWTEFEERYVWSPEEFDIRKTCGYASLFISR